MTQTSNFSYTFYQQSLKKQVSNTVTLYKQYQLKFQESTPKTFSKILFLLFALTVSPLTVFISNKLKQVSTHKNLCKVKQILGYINAVHLSV